MESEISYFSYLEEELGPEEDVEETQEHKGGEAREQAATQIQVLPVRCHQGGSWYHTPHLTLT